MPPSITLQFKMNSMRKLIVFLLALLSAVLAVPLLHGETVKTMPKPTGYVDDYANVFSGTAQSKMEALCREVHDKTKAQVFVVTINTLENSSIEEFANELFHSWKIGEKKTDRGILILLAIKAHKYRIEVGYGFEGILNDAKAGDIGREMVLDLKAANYDGAAETSLGDVSKIIADDSHVTFDALASLIPGIQSTPPPSIDKPQPAARTLSPGLTAIVVIILFLIIGVTIIWVLGTLFNAIAGLFRRGSSSGGSFSSDSSNSSSSVDFGGGDGGDGGDSGGGGASGDW
jgi:uncharacterized protein